MHISLIDQFFPADGQVLLIEMQGDQQSQGLLTGKRESTGYPLGLSDVVFRITQSMTTKKRDGREDTSLSNTRFHCEPLGQCITEDDTAFKVVVERLYQ